MLSAEFEPTISAGERSQSHVLGCEATGPTNSIFTNISFLIILTLILKIQEFFQNRLLEKLPCAQVSKNFKTDIRALLGCYAACSGKFLLTFRHNISFPSSMDKKSLFTHEEGTDRLSRNVSMNLPLHSV